MQIGIDASNITEGGGITHISNLLNNLSFDKKKNKIKKIYIWGIRKTLNSIKNTKFIKKIYLPLIFEHTFFRLIWQIFYFDYLLIKNKCNKGFVLGGFFFRTSVKKILLVQNLLPFDETNKSYSFFSRIKFIIQKILITRSIFLSKKVIFLSLFSKNKIEKKINKKIFNYKIIHHGIKINNFKKKKNNLINKKNIKILYVSKIEFYKNQITLIKAVEILRKKNFNIKLDFVGPSYKPALNQFLHTINALNKKNKEICYKYLGEKKNREISKIYSKYDVHVVPSKCETFGQIVLESLASKLPTLCSDIQVFKEIAGQHVIYFNPNKEKSISKKILMIINNKVLRNKVSKQGYSFVKKNFSWQLAADQTFKLFYD